jgi:hypothetical protein
MAEITLILYIVNESRERSMDTLAIHILDGTTVHTPFQSIQELIYQPP